MSGVAELTDDEVFGTAAAAPRELSDDEVFGAAPAADPGLTLAPLAPPAPKASDSATRPPPSPLTLAPADPSSIGYDIPEPPPAPPGEMDTRRDRSAYVPLGAAPPTTPNIPQAPGADQFTRAGNLGRAGYQAQQGWEGIRTAGANMMVLGALRDLETARAGTVIEPGAGMAMPIPDRMRQQATDAAYKRLVDAVMAQNAANERYAAIPKSPAHAQFIDNVNRGNWRAAAETFMNAPGEIIQAATIPAVIQAGPAIAVTAASAGLGAIPAFVGALGSSFTSRVAPETMGAMARRLQERGVDLADADAVARELSNNPQLVAAAFQAGGQASMASAFVDAVGLRMMRPIVPRAGLVANGGALASNLGRATVQGPISSAAGQLVGEGEIYNKGAIADAGLAGFGMGAMGTAVRSVDAAKPGGYRPIDLPPLRPGEPPAPRPSIAPPPGPQGGPPALSPPPGGPPAVSPPPVPGAGARPSAPTVPPVAAGAGAGGLTVGQQVQVLDRPTATWGPAQVSYLGAGSDVAVVTRPDGSKIAVPIGEILPQGAQPQASGGVQPPQTAAPTAAPPAPAVLTEAEKAASDLEKVMADPRTNAEIAAEKQAAETALIESVPAALPPGFLMAPDPDSGGFMVLTPSGELIGRLEPGAVTQATIEGVLADAALLNSNVDYYDYTRVGDGTRANPVVVQQPSDIHAAGANVNTEPTDGQKEAGSYQKGHVRLHGLDIAIENPAGSTRTGTDPNGQPWSVDLPYDYGYIKRTRGADNDQVDVLLGPQAHEAPQHPVWVIDQRNADTGAFDEHKAMIGFPTREAAEMAYHEGFSDGRGPERAGTWNEMGFPQFQRWVKAGPKKDAISYQDPRPAAEGAVKETASGAGIRLNPDEAAAATDLVVQGETPAHAILAVVGAAALAAEERTDFKAPADYDVVRAELEFWAKKLGLTLTPTQMVDAMSLIVQGQTPPEAVLYAGAIQPAIEAEAAASAALQTEQEIADATRRDEPSAEIPRPGEPVADQGGQPTEPERERAPEPAPDSEQPPPGGGEVPAVAPRPIPPRAETDGQRPPVAERPRDEIADEGGDRGTDVEGQPAAETGQADLAGVTGFRTAKGSTYIVHPDGTTTRNKAARPEHPGEEGIQPRSRATYYVNSEDAIKLAEIQTTGGGGARAIVPSGPGGLTIGIRYLDGPSAGKVERRTVVNSVRNPHVGLTPVELWKNGRVVHFGNPITELFREGVPDAQPETEAPTTDLAKPANAGTIDAPNQIGLAHGFRDAFLAGRAFKTIVQARALAGEWLGGKIQPGTAAAKLTDEAIELGAVLAARQIVSAGQDPDETFDRLLHLYDVQQPRLGVRTGSSMERQAYSTPLPLAYTVSRLGGAAHPKAMVYEPTAGNGALLIEADPEATIANELDPERQAALKEQGFIVRGHDAITFAPQPKIDVVLANPPFGVLRGPNGGNTQFDMAEIQDGYSTTQIDHAIALKSLRQLRDDGRAVFILGGIDKQVRDPDRRADAYNGKMKREFFFTLYGKYNVVDHFTVPGELYAGQGAAWPVDVIVIHGRGKSSLPLPSVKAPRIVAGWPEIKEIMLNAPPLALSDEPAPSVEPGPGEQPPAGGAAASGGQDADQPDVSGASPGAAGVDAGGGPGTDGGRAPAGEGPAGPRNVGGGSDVREPLGDGDQRPGGQPDLAEPPAKPSVDAGEGAVPGGEPTGSNRSDQGYDAGGLAGEGDRQQAGSNGQIAEDLTAPPPDIEDQVPATERKKDAPTAGQAPYTPFSKADPVGTLVPVNQATATQAALERLEQENGKIDAFVAEKLGYTPAEVLKYFSAEQVDALGLAIKQVDAGRGFVIGDMTGVGKGRVVAGMIRYALRQGLTPVFVTEKPNLYADMARDLTDIGMEDILGRVLMTNNNERIPYTEDPKGPALKSPVKAKHDVTIQEAVTSGRLPAAYDVLFTTYAQMQQNKGQNTIRMRLLASLAPNAFLIMDESHNAGGAGAAAEERQKPGKISRSRFFRTIISASKSVFYSSATWAKRPDVMDLYGLKTDMALAVKNIADLADVIASGGIPMQQIVTSQLAQVGQYVRRERSFEGVTYDMTPIDVDKPTYDKIAGVLADIFKISDTHAKRAIKDVSQTIRDAAAQTTFDGSTGGAGASSTSFGSIMHNLISQMLLASKAKGAVDLALGHLRAGRKPVIAVANTMGSFIEEFAGEAGASPGDPLDLTFNSLLMNYLQKTLRYSVKKPFSAEKPIQHTLKPSDLGPTGEALFAATARKIKSLNLDAFPVSPIDYMRSELMRAGYKVGEVTGRTEAADYKENGDVTYRLRPGKELTPAGRTAAVRAFNAGDLDVMVLNQSGATGLSLHANAPFKDRRKRVMLIVQAESNIDVFMQMLGRVHRTGQVMAPAYEQLVADVPAEMRPAAVLAMKMASLSASTTSNRRSAMSSDAIDFMNKYGGQVIARMLEEDSELNASFGDLLHGSGGIDAEDDEDPTSVARKVTGRIPLLPLKEQERVYAEITRRYVALIEELDAAGENGLEARTLDLDAQELEVQTVFDGYGTSPFTASAHAVRYSVKRQTKPPTSPELVISIGAHYPIPSRSIPKASTAEEAASAIVSMMEQYGPDFSKGHIADLISAAAIATDRANAVDPARRAAELQKVADAEAHIQAILQMAKPGAIVELQSGAGRSLAMVYEVNRSKKANAAARSSWEIYLFDDIGRRRSVPISQVFPPQIAPTIEDLTDNGWRVMRPTTANHADFLSDLEARGKVAREERWIITGNIMAGFSSVGQSGQILNFTDDKGAVHQGIIMSDGWSFDFHQAATGARMTAVQAASFLGDETPHEDVAPPFITASDESFWIRATDQKNVFFMDVERARSAGGPYYMAGELRRYMRGGDFFSRDVGMRGTFERKDLAAVVREAARILGDANGHLVSRHPRAVPWMNQQRDGGIRTDQQALPGAEITDTRLRWSDDERPIRADAFAVLSETVQAMTGYRTEIIPVKRPVKQRDGSGEAGGVQVGGKLILIGIRGSVATGWALHHEAVHTLRAYDLIQPAEWTVLTRAAQREDWGARYHVNVRWPNLEREEKQEEAVAEAFGEYSQKRRPVPQGMISRAFRRTTTFFARLKSSLAGKGFTRPEDVFERIISGEVGKREANPIPGRVGTMEQAQYAVASNLFWDHTKSPFVEERPDDLAVRNPDGTIAIDLMAGMSEPLKRMMREAAAPARRHVGRWLDAFYGRTGTSQITIEEPKTARDFGLGRFLGNPVMIPRQLFAGDPALARLVQKGIEAEEAQSKWNQELTEDYERIGKKLNRAGGSFANVQTALIYGDAEEIDVTDEGELSELFDAMKLDPAEQTAFREYTKLLEKVARFIDQHRRSMEKKVLAEKARIWQRMTTLLGTARVTGDADFNKLYRRRNYLTKQVREAKGDLDAHAREIDRINDQLRRFRLADPELQERLTTLQDEYDALEGRLQAVQVRGRRKGYVPHRFFGSWRLHVLEPETEDANIQWREITSDQGFYSTRTDAIAAAKKYLADNPDAQLRIQPRAPDWPPGLEGTELSDKAYAKLRNEIEEVTGLEGDDLNEAMQGVARRRFRRRILSAARYRTGKAGYSQDMDKVMRTHIGAAVRYVVFDRLKFLYVNTIEAAGLSRNRGATVQDRPQMQKAIEAWWRDVNGAKQPMESHLDNILRAGGIPAATMTAGAVAGLAGFGAGLGVIWTPLLASWAGWRMYRALKDGGDFPFRTLNGGIVSDIAHFKLGMIFNLHSGVVNLTQTMLNTYPVLGAKYTTIGLKRALAALWAQSRGQDTPDAILLRRAGVRTQFHLSDSNTMGASGESLASRISMFGFNTTETFNRAVSFLGAYAQKQEANASPAQAMRHGQAVMRRTQFHYGNADKPMLLRQQWARIPLQFKNYMLHQIALAFGFRRAEIPRFLGSLYVVAGLVGIPGLQALDWLHQFATGQKLTTEIRHAAVEAAKNGKAAGNIALAMAYGLPGYLGSSVSASVGMGDRFLPTEPRDLAGPMIGTVATLGQAVKKGAGLTDQLRAVSPSFAWLKALETAADGNQITSAAFWNAANWQRHTLTDWRHRGAAIYNPTRNQLLLQGFGFTPIEQTVRQDEFRRVLEMKAKDPGKANAYLARIVEAKRRGTPNDIPAILREARAAKVHISAQMIKNAVQAAQQDITARGVRQTPTRNRPGAAQDRRALDTLFE